MRLGLGRTWVDGGELMGLELCKLELGSFSSAHGLEGGLIQSFRGMGADSDKETFLDRGAEGFFSGNRQHRQGRGPLEGCWTLVCISLRCPELNTCTGTTSGSWDG